MIESRIDICRRIPPEDFRPGLFVVILSVVHELIGPWELGDPALDAPRLFHITCTTCSDGEPLRVLSVCLPFVQVEDAVGELRTLDIRRTHLAAVSEDYALEAFTRPALRCTED